MGLLSVQTSIDSPAGAASVTGRIDLQPQHEARLAVAKTNNRRTHLGKALRVAGTILVQTMKKVQSQQF